METFNFVAAACRLNITIMLQVLDLVGTGIQVGLF